MTDQDERTQAAPTLPETLDPGAWIALALSSEHPIERLLALDEIAFQGLGSDFSGDIERIATDETSEECSYRAKQLVAALTKKRFDRKIEKVELTPERTKALLEVGEDTLRRTVQLSLRKPPTPEILDTWRAHILSEDNSEVIAVGLTLLAKFGTSQDAGLASAFADHPSPSVVKATIDLLHSQHLDRFKERAASFLTSDDIEIRLHAIRKLRSFDPAEAQTYLRSMLSARDPMIRQRGIRELLLVPFSESEALYLAYLAAEPVPLLLSLAGSAVAMNPSADLPLKLYDIFAGLRGTRAHILQLVIKQLIASIKASGILEESIEQYLEKLKEALRKRKLQTACRIALNDLTHEEPETRLAAVRILVQGLDVPKVREALEQLQMRETTEEIRELLLQVLGKTHDEYSIETLRRIVRDGSFYDLDPKSQRRHLSAIRDQESFTELRETIGILLLAKLDRSVLLHLFDRISTHGVRWDPKPMFPHLKHEDPGVVAAALRTIGRFDIDCISYEIPNYLRQDDVRIKTAALELYLVSDRASALQYLTGMLKSPQMKVRKNSLSLLATVDFASVQNLLLEYLPAEKNAELRTQAAFILATNPTREGFSVLYRCTHDVNGVILPDTQDLWDAVIAGAIPLLAPDIASLMATVARKPAPAESTAPEVPPAYTFKKVTASSSKNLYGEKDQLPGSTVSPQFAEAQAREAIDRAAGFAGEHRTLIAAAVAVFAIAGLWWFVGDRLSLPGGSGSTSRVVHETQAARMEEGGSKAPSMVAGARGSPGQFLSGSGYASSMKAMHDERLSISAEFARKNEQALQETLMQMSGDPNYKGYAEFYLNENCKMGLECIEKGDFKEARDYLMKALEDTSISEEARVLVCQSLLGIGYEVGDKDALEKAMDRLLAMIPEKDLPKEYNRQSMKEAFDGLKRMHEITPQQFSEIMQKLAREHPGKVPPEMQEKMLEGFKQMQNRFK